MFREDFNYETIKELAKDHGYKVSELLAMSSNNDPFYMGTEADVRNGRWFRQLYLRSNRPQIHLRALHYIAVSVGFNLPTPIKQGRIRTDEYLNTDESWQFLIKASSAARWLGLVSFNSIIDNKNDDPTVRFHQFYQHDDPQVGFELPDLDNIHIKAYTASAADVMPYYMCLFSEKSSVSYIVDPLAEKYHVDTQYFSGEFSHTAINDLVRRIEEAERPAILFVLSDFDAAGRSIAKSAARRVEYLVAKHLGELDMSNRVIVKQIMLTKKQVEAYGLPFTPMKASEKRADKFLDAMGVDGAVEIDAMLALHPDEFEAIIEGAFETYSDLEKLAEAGKVAKQLRKDMREQIDKIKGKYKKEVEAVKKMFEQIEALSESADMQPYQVQRSKFRIDNMDYEAIYDSDLEYISQIQRYRDWEQGYCDL